MNDGSTRTVTVRTLVLSVVAASLVSIGAAFALSYALIGTPEPGPRGPAGEQGPPGIPGTRGARGVAVVEDEEVWRVIEDDPQRLADVVQDYLDPAPADVQAEVETVASDLTTLCSDLSFADALSSEFITCP